MALAQQVTYSTAVVPLLLPFRNLLRDETLWDWTEELGRWYYDIRSIKDHNIADRLVLAYYYLYFEHNYELVQLYNKINVGGEKSALNMNPVQ